MQNFETMGDITRSEDVEMDSVEQGSEVWMDGDLWGKLPEHMMDNILAKLPVFNFLRLRSVCKRWNSLVWDPLFLDSCSRATSSDAPPLFLLYPDYPLQSYPAYDPTLNKWYLLPSVDSSGPGSLRSLSVVAAAGGLLCLMDGNSSSEEAISLYVLNPITKAKRRLPPVARLSKRYVVQMAVNSQENTYKIAVVFSRECLQAVVYDVVSNTWQMIGHMLNRHQHAMRVGTTSRQGILYGLTGGSDNSVSAYHVDRGTWEDIRAPMPAYLTSPQLFVSRGELMLVGAIPVMGVIQTVCVWQLDPKQMEWVEVFKLPDDLLSGISKGGRLGFYNFFVPGGDFVCFAHLRVNQLLMCNIFEKTWWWLPLSPVDIGTDAPNSTRFPENFTGFPLRPSLAAFV